jgi:copper(I)-binding protein
VRSAGDDGDRFLPRAGLAALLAIACSGTPQIRIAEPRVMVSPSFTGVCAVFLRIENAGDGSDALVRAEVDVPGAIAELHDVQDGKMVRRDRIPVRARSVLELAPGGLHIMVFNLPKDVAGGKELQLRLVFERSGEKVTSVRIAGRAPATRRAQRERKQPFPCRKRRS